MIIAAGIESLSANRARNGQILARCCARAPVKRVILKTMKELINTIVQKTGISQEDAQKTVQVVVGFLKTKMPGPFAAQLDSFLSGSARPQETGDFLKSKVEGGVLAGKS